MLSALPVYRGELQCRLLGMAIETYTPSGTPSERGEPGELVCVQPFPCMPLGFWPLSGFGDEDAVKAAAVRYQESYFSEYKDIWCKSTFRFDFPPSADEPSISDHGDHVVITPSRAGNGGGLIMLGRSDGVL